MISDYNPNMIKVMAFGDSITFGAWDKEGGWVERLKKYFFEKEDKENGFEAQVFNLGIPGETSTGLLARLEGEIKARAGNQETWCLVMTGTNDLAILDGVQGTIIEEYGQNIEKIIEIIKHFGCKIIFLNLLPIDEEIANDRMGYSKKRYNSDVKKYNQELVKVCDKYRVKLVDINGVFMGTDWKKLFYDGLHPNSEGHKLIFEVIKGLFN